MIYSHILLQNRTRHCPKHWLPSSLADQHFKGGYMDTLAKLKAGLLTGASRVQIASGLTEFPRELFNLTDSLEIIDLSGNQLSTLPDDFDRFTKLRILFLSNNNFETVPQVLAACPALSMIGFKSNRISQVPEDALPEALRWLILTDNQIHKLPDSMGKHMQLQKLMLAGNLLTSLPESMSQCKNLELVRISANKFTDLPMWLLHLPKLSWLAFAGNPCSQSLHDHSLPEIHWDELEVGGVLGQGASGVINKATWSDKGNVALKTFKGKVTSDGFPADEMAAAIAAGKHDHLVEVIGKLKGHPEEKDGLLLSLIADDFRNLAEPPCLDSCTRDRYTDGQTFSLKKSINIATAIAAAAAHLHQQGISHGDLYGHNILLNDDAHCLLSDFGAASLHKHFPETKSEAIERLEVRAFACLLEELLAHIQPEDNSASEATALNLLHEIRAACATEQTPQRPLFKDISQTLKSISLAA